MRNWTTVEKILIALIAIGAFLWGAEFARAAPCFDSLEAARAAYPTGNIAWAGHPRKFFKGHAGERVKCDASTEERKAIRHEPRRLEQKKQRHPQAFAGAVFVDPSIYEGPSDFNGRFFAYMGNPWLRERVEMPR